MKKYGLRPLLYFLKGKRNKFSLHKAEELNVDPVAVLIWPRQDLRFFTRKLLKNFHYKHRSK